MNSAIERLLALRVADAMTKEVVRLSPQESMAAAAEILVDHHITGAPVVDGNDCCVGVLSATDFVREFRTQCEQRSASPAINLGIATNGRSDIDIVGTKPNLVAEHMTSPVRSVAEDTTLLDATRAMCDRHVHRMLVLDDRGRLRGVLSALDVLTAVIQAVEE